MTNFKAVLLNTKYDREYRNVLRFETRGEQERYFNLPSLFLNSVDINFNAGSLLETTIIYRIRENESINDILSKNYCIIQDLNENRTLQYYYYFIRNAIQDVAGQVKLWLELDIFQTYYIDVDFTPCNIQKAHLNRFIDIGEGKVAFDGGIDSKLFEREDVRNVAKRLTKRTKISLYNELNASDEVKQWMQEHIKCWVYLFLDNQHKYKLPSGRDAENYADKDVLTMDIRGKGKTTRISTNFAVWCIPIADKGIYYQTDWFKSYIGTNAVKAFMQNNNGAAYIYAMKISANPPFYDLSKADTFSIDENGDLIIQNWSPLGSVSEGVSYGNTYINGYTYTTMTEHKQGDVFYSVFGIDFQDDVLSSVFDTGIQYTFNKTDIIGANKDAKFNPKLLSNDYFSINIGNENGNFEYDAQKLNTNKINIEYTEPLLPDTTKVYVRYKGDRNSIYIENTSENFTGFVDNNDTSLVLVTTQYQNMLAQNKNFFQQNAINRTFAGVLGGLGAGASLGTGLASLPTGGLGAIAAGAVGAIGAISGVIKSSINEQLSVDNMKNAPASIQNAKGSAFLNFMSTPIGAIVEQYEILPHEKNIINDFMCLYGFTANFVDNIKNYDNIRKYYNYIQAEIEETTGINISNAVHDKFRQAFRQGVRFWNTDNFDFEKENYERWLENG